MSGLSFYLLTHFCCFYSSGCGITNFQCPQISVACRRSIHCLPCLSSESSWPRFGSICLFLVGSFRRLLLDWATQPTGKLWDSKQLKSWFSPMIQKSELCSGTQNYPCNYHKLLGTRSILCRLLILPLLSPLDPWISTTWGTFLNARWHLFLDSTLAQGSTGISLWSPSLILSLSLALKCSTPLILHLSAPGQIASSGSTDLFFCLPKLLWDGKNDSLWLLISFPH